MKTLHLIRHAKSSWDHPDLADVERPLNDRGEQACRLMAPAIYEAGCRFENVFCSIATRAQMTIQGISDALPDMQIQWEVDPELYTFSSNDIIDWLSRLNNGIRDVVIVGHNPAFTSVINQLGDQHLDNLPTCGYAQIELPTHFWKDLEETPGKTKVVLTPKEVR